MNQNENNTCTIYKRFKNKKENDSILFTLEYKRNKESKEKQITRQRNKLQTGIFIFWFLNIVFITYCLVNNKMLSAFVLILLLFIPAIPLMDTFISYEEQKQREEQYYNFWLRCSQNRIICFALKLNNLEYQYEEGQVVKTDSILIDDIILDTSISNSSIVIDDNCIFHKTFD